MFLCGIVSSCFGAIVHIQSVGDDPGTVATDTLAYASNVTAGSLLILAARHGSATASVSSVTDTLGNTWTLAKRMDDPSGHSHNIWFANSPTGGANTVTINIDETQSLRWIVLEYSGLGTASIDVSTSSIGSGTSADTGGVTPTQSNVLAFSACDVNGVSGFTAGSGYTERVEVATKIAAQDKVVASPSSITGAWTLDTSENWISSLVVFKGTTGASGSVVFSPGTGSVVTSPGTGTIIFK